MAPGSLAMSYEGFRRTRTFVARRRIADAAGGGGSLDPRGSSGFTSRPDDTRGLRGLGAHCLARRLRVGRRSRLGRSRVRIPQRAFFLFLFLPCRTRGSVGWLLAALAPRQQSRVSRILLHGRYALFGGPNVAGTRGAALARLALLLAAIRLGRPFTLPARCANSQPPRH